MFSKNWQCAVVAGVLALLVVVFGTVATAQADTISAFVTAPTGGDTFASYNQVGFGFYETAPSVTINRLGYYDAGGDGLGAAHDVGLYKHVGGDTPYELIAKATVPSGTAAPLSNGYRWASIPTLTIADTRGPGDYYILMAYADVADARYEPTVGLFTGSASFGVLTGDSLWVSDVMPAVGTQVAAFNITTSTGGYVGANMGYAVPEPSLIVLLASGMIGLLCYAWRKRK